MNSHAAIAIGVSAGGVNALSIILPAFPEDFTMPVIVVQHRVPDSDDDLITHLNRQAPLLVKEAEIGERIGRGAIYIAPPDYHLLVEDDHTFSLSDDPPVNHARPSIDVLFESAADAYGKELVGVILTGANSDGALGLKCIKENGGMTIVQDPENAESACMPRAAIELVGPDHILALNEIGPFLRSKVHANSCA